MQISVILSECPKVQHTLVLQNPIGQGKFQVFHVKAISLPEPTDFALKVFPRAIDTNHHFEREQRMLSRLNHPHIITYIPIFRHSLKHPLLVTEYTPNGDFFDFVSQGGISNNEKLIRTY